MIYKEIKMDGFKLREAPTLFPLAAHPPPHTHFWKTVHCVRLNKDKKLKSSQ